MKLIQTEVAAGSGVPVEDFRAERAVRFTLPSCSLSPVPAAATPLLPPVPFPFPSMRLACLQSQHSRCASFQENVKAPHCTPCTDRSTLDPSILDQILMVSSFVPVRSCRHCHLRSIWARSFTTCVHGWSSTECVLRKCSLICSVNKVSRTYGESKPIVT